MKRWGMKLAVSLALVAGTTLPLAIIAAPSASADKPVVCVWPYKPLPDQNGICVYMP